MRKLGFVLFVMLAAGCSKKSSSEKACQHLIDLAKADLDKEIEKIKVLDKDGSMTKFTDDMRDQANRSTKSDLATCVTHKIDSGCILDAASLDDASECLHR